MFAKLVQKELLNYLLDFRFITILSLCTLLTILSVYVGTRTYDRQLREHGFVAEKNPTFIKDSVNKGYLYFLELYGYQWIRPPEVLSPVVYGLSGDIGQVVHIRQQRLWRLEDSLFSVDPTYALFEILDFAFIVKVILSLCVLLLTYDAVCGEKETGTLRLYASFSVPRGALALAKLAGSTIAVLVPFLFSFVLTSVIMTMNPNLDMHAQDWFRMVILMFIFAVYLAIFAAFGIWGSALTHRRLTSFLGLLGLWSVWIFILPNICVRIAQNLEPVNSVYTIEKQAAEVRWEVRKEKKAAEIASNRSFLKRHNIKLGPEGARSMSPKMYRKMGGERAKALAPFETEFQPRLKSLFVQRRNQLRRQQDLAVSLSFMSPIAPLSFASMDLARTGTVQQEHLEIALDGYQVYLGKYLEEKQITWSDLNDFSFFTYRDTDTLEECLSRNAFHILNLVLLAILGFAGAYVAILRYDVR